MPMIETGHKVKITLSADKVGTSVHLDGVAVQGLVCVEVRHHAGDVSRVKLELLPSEIEIVGDVGEVERVEASPEDARRVRTDGLLHAALEGLKKRNYAEAEGQ